jgi:hypothetical protein
MSTWLVVWLVVGLVTTVALAAFSFWLVRHAILVGRTMGRVSDELTPLTDEIARGSTRASERAAALGMPPRSKPRTRRR